VCVFDGTYYKITTTNYISKTSLYTTFCMYPSRPLPLKILMFAQLVTACDPWDNNIQLTMIKDRRPGPGMPFLDSNTCAKSGLFISARVFFPVWCHPWMDDETDGWMEKALRPWRPLLYVIGIRRNVFPKTLKPCHL
jgi:hypothetical protein